MADVLNRESLTIIHYCQRSGSLIESNPDAPLGRDIVAKTILDRVKRVRNGFE